MLSFHSLSLYNIKQPLSLPQFSWLANKKTTPIVSLRLTRIDGRVSKKTSKNQSCFVPSFIVHAIEKDSQNFEIDSDKAKDALQKLDQQLQAFSEKQISPPKIRASDVKLTRDEITEEVPEVSGSALAYTAVAMDRNIGIPT
ncbi:unnamed protein product [Dovyalis caffra]|uniref:Uncharacterized protein n=1 Tax=Dovyalis caffra TaxID=77055 RepID=A0AAV1RBJ9_9ROSI|nr:unnamed protein product [Dovyalis caffra]